MNKEFLTSEEVLLEAQARKIPLNERKLKYYVTIGLLDKPVKSPYADSDGRKMFHHSSVLERLIKINDLQESGLTLPQIKQYLTNDASCELKDLADKGLSSLPLYSFLSMVSDDDIRRVRARFSQKIYNVSDETLIENAAFDYYVELLSLYIGKSRAEIAVKKFFTNTPHDLKWKNIKKLIADSKNYILKGSSSSFSIAIASLCDECRKGSMSTEQILEKIKEYADKVYYMQHRYTDSVSAIKNFFELSKLIRQPFWLYLKSLLAIESYVKDGDKEHLSQAAAISLKADALLDQLEDIVTKIKSYLNSYLDSEKIL